MAWPQLVAGFAVALLAGAHLHGEYIITELQDVPVDRLVANLERIAKGTPRDVQSRLNLARLHAMAFALKTNTVQIQKGREASGPYFGNEPAHVPFKSVPTTEAAVLARAEAHMAKAIERYREVIALDPANLTAKLGYAWWGRELAGLAIWRDANKSGVAEAGEVRPLNDWGVVSLSCAYQDGPADSDTVAFSPAGVTLNDGTTRPTYDVILSSRVDGERR